jgi:hypothetical protein
MIRAGNADTGETRMAYPASVTHAMGTMKTLRFCTRSDAAATAMYTPAAQK